MRVCHVTCQHGKEDVRVFHKECSTLAQKGYDVFLVQQGDSYQKNGVSIVGYGERSKNIRIIRRLIDIKHAEKIAMQVDADLYHLHEPLLLPFYRKLKKRGKKVIFDSHERYTEQIKLGGYFTPNIRRIIAFLYGKYEMFALRQIDGAIFPCLKDGIHPFEGMCKRVITLNNLPKLSELYDRYDGSIVKIDDSLCYLGTLSFERGVTNAIKAAYKSKSKLLLGGHFSTPEYKEEVLKMKEMDNVRYLGDLDRDGVCKTIQTCEIGMANLLNVGQYNKYDNLATKVYEYMSLGIPVILSRSVFNKKMIDKYHFGLCVDPDNVDEIVEAINALKGDKALRQEMGINGRKAVVNEFNWEKESQKLIDLYRSIESDLY